METSALYRVQREDLPRLEKGERGVGKNYGNQCVVSSTERGSAQTPENADRVLCGGSAVSYADPLWKPVRCIEYRERICPDSRKC